MSAARTPTRTQVAGQRSSRRSSARVLRTSAMVAEDGRAGPAAIRRTVPDVVLMDVRMPVLDGLAALREITADPARARVRVVVPTTFELDEYVFAALAGGASGFVLKDSEPADLLRAIRVVAVGGSLLAPSVTRRVIAEFTAGRRVTPHR